MKISQYNSGNRKLKGVQSLKKKEWAGGDGGKEREKKKKTDYF